MNETLNFSQIFKLACDLGSADPALVANSIVQSNPNPKKEDVYFLCLKQMADRLLKLEDKLASKE